MSMVFTFDLLIHAFLGLGDWDMPFGTLELSNDYVSLLVMRSDSSEYLRSLVLLTAFYCMTQTGNRI